ncbi:MAG: hypothetical protein WCO00_08765 [Rhodospirillaceae bacterium]
MASPGTPVAASGNATILIYLSLFLLLLVFFIVLVAHSTPRDYRVRAVLSSVEQSFAPVVRAGTEAVSGQGSAAAIALSGLKRLGDLFETELAIVKVARSLPGRVLVAGTETRDLFEDGTARLRPERIGLLDRIAREIGDRAGVRFEVDFLIAIGPEPAGRRAIGDPVAQAAALGKALIADGAPPDAVSVGIEPGVAGSARFLFAARLPGEPRRAGGGRAAP